MENTFKVPEIQEILDLLGNEDNIPAEYEKAENIYTESFNCIRDKVKNLLDGKSESNITTDLLKLDVDVCDYIAQAEIYGFRLGARLALTLATK